MLRKIINKLKKDKQQLQNITSNNTKEEYPIENNNIVLSKENNYYKIEIKDYISISDYVQKTNSSKEYDILNLISNNILWNSSKQCIEKGIFYIIQIDNRLYNILITDKILKIDERTNKEIDNQTMKDNITEEKIVTLNLDSFDYRYTSFKHDKTGDTYYVRYYSSIKFNNFLKLSDEEALSEISLIIYNLENIENIENIINIQLLKEHLSNNLNKNNYQKTRTLNT